MTMWKKIAFWGVVVVAAVALLSHTKFGMRAGSYASLFWKKACTEVDNQVPMEAEIERLRHETAQLIPDVKVQAKEVAKQIVEVEDLQKQVDHNQANHNKRKETILAMKNELKSATDKELTRVSYKDEDLSVQELADRVEEAMSIYKQEEIGLKADKQLLATKKKSLASATKQLREVRTKKRELEARLATLEAKVQELRLTQKETGCQIDSTRLSRIQNSMTDLEKRLKVEERAQVLLKDVQDEENATQQKAKSPQNVIKSVEETLEDNTGKPEKVAADRK